MLEILQRRQYVIPSLIQDEFDGADPQEIVARSIAEALSDKLRQAVVTEHLVDPNG